VGPLCPSHHGLVRLDGDVIESPEVIDVLRDDSCPALPGNGTDQHVSSEGVYVVLSDALGPVEVCLNLSGAEPVRERFGTKGRVTQQALLHSAYNSQLEMATKDEAWNTALDAGGAAFELLGNARKAWIYTYVRHHPSTTVGDVVETLDLPERTVYEYVDDLEGAGFVEQSNEGRPAEYTAHDIDLHLVVGETERRITPVLVEAIARRLRDDDVDAYVDRHGLDGLAVALEYAREYVDGSVTHRVMAREQELSSLEAGVILDALRPVVED